MRPVVVVAALMAALCAGLWTMADPAVAATSKKRQHEPVARTASGTIIQPTTTIIHDGSGHTTYIVIPRQRSYLDTGTEVSVGDRSFQDYMLPPGGDPGRPNWFIGPDVQGGGGYPLPRAFYIPGINPNTPF